MRMLVQFFPLILFMACNQGTSTKNPGNSGKGVVLFYNGDIVTMETDIPEYVEALLVSNGKIIFAGKKKEAETLAGEGFEMVDLAGKTMLPGFIDGHSHLTNYADGLMQADLNPPPIGAVTDIPGIIKAITDLKQKLNAKDNELLVGFGYDADMLNEKRHPNTADLDAAFPNNPVILKHASGHMLVANTAAFKLAGISSATRDPTGGTFIRKKGSQELDGLVQEMAMQPFMPLMARPLPMEVEMKKIRDAQAYYASCGVTTANEHLAMIEKMVLLDTAAARGELYLDLIALPAFIYAKEVLGTNKVKWRTYNNHLKYQGLKMATDGSPQGKTAFLTKPYLTPVPGCTHNCVGFPNMPQEQINQLMLACYKAGVQLFSHCNGDASIDMMIKGHQYAIRALGDSTSDRRTVIIHSQIMRPDQLDEYKKYKMIPSFFTNHTFYWGDVHIANLGKERAGFLSPMRSAIDKGILATNHTDNIVTPMDQLFLLWTSVNRVSRNGVVVGEAERITAYEGLKAQTINGAYEYFEEDIKGSLKAGKMADLVILDKNPLKVDKTAIRDIKVVETLKEGRTVYKRP
jgi:predicted amidohydrolase YtcJ